MVEVKGKFADEFITKMITDENRPPTEKEKELIRKIEENRYEFDRDRAFICEKCGRKLLGVSEVNKHKDDNWDHFTYGCLGTNAVLGFA